MKRLSIFLLLIFFAFSGFAQKSSDDTGLPDDELLVYIPNAFSPNADGYNDVFRPVITGPELEMYELLIVSRNGIEVFYSKDPSEVWTGDLDGSSYTTAPSIFVYFLKVKSVSDLAVKTFTGHVVMVR
jgi:gliding motility-associated-like protein